MAQYRSSTKKEIEYAENLCRELEKQVKVLEKKLQQGNPELENSRNKHAIIIELNEVQKLLMKYTDQLDHLRTHDSIPLKIIMALILVIFTVWMIFVLTNNTSQGSSETNELT